MSSIEKKLKNIIICYFIVVIAFLLFAITTLYINGVIINVLIYTTLLIYTFILTFKITRLSFSRILPLLKPYLYFITIITIYKTLFSFYYSPNNLLFYLLLIYIFYVLYGKKTTFRLGVFFVSIITISYAYELFNFNFYNQTLQYKSILYNQSVYNVTILVLTFFYALTFFLQKNYNLYLQEKNNQININNQQIDTHDTHIEIKKLDNNTGTDQLILNDENKEVYNQLYKRLINEFEVNKLYLKKDINLVLLSEILNTNTTYLSKAINICTSDNFNTLLNQYRIAYFKNLVNDKKKNTQTLNPNYALEISKG